MNLPISVTQNDLLEILINIAPVRPVFIWGAPGIGKSALVEQFAREVEMPCVSLLGSQLAPEDIIGIPQIRGETSEFLPPKMIARKEPYVLFLDELNACTQEVQKAFYSLIHERRIGEYHLPEGSIVVGAGNRAQDSAIVKTMSSALINRMFHVQMKADARQWIKWAQSEGLHPWVIDYIIQRPDHLFSEPPKTEEPFSTPRSWHMLSDALTEYGAGKRAVSMETLKCLRMPAFLTHMQVCFWRIPRRCGIHICWMRLLRRKQNGRENQKSGMSFIFWRSLSGQNCLRNFQKANRIFPEICFRLSIGQKV